LNIAGTSSDKYLIAFRQWCEPSSVR